jgi:hypothetical protein
VAFAAPLTPYPAIFLPGLIKNQFQLYLTPILFSKHQGARAMAGHSHLHILKAMISRQFQAQAAACPGIVPASQKRQIPPPLGMLKTAYSHKQGFAALMQNPAQPNGNPLRDELVEHFKDLLYRYLHTWMQFSPISSSLDRQLSGAYERHLQGLATALNQSASLEHCQKLLALKMDQHFTRLEKLLTPWRRSCNHLAIGANYSPELQIRLLSLAPHSLPVPVLDLGCGSGELVRHLQTLGVMAQGMDRYAPRGREFIRADWLQSRFEPGRWGSIISHMAFSNHFLHHHLNPGSDPRNYALLYTRLSRALKTGGFLVYTPGLPFMEELLPKGRYQVTRTPVALPKGDFSRLFAWYGYACRVTRL